MKKELRNVYITKDNKVFLDEQKARQHELDMSKTRIFLVHHSPDLNEGRGYIKKGILKVTADSNHRLFAEEWCNQHIGAVIQYVQGYRHPNAAMSPWILVLLDDETDMEDCPVMDTITIG